MHTIISSLFSSHPVFDVKSNRIKAVYHISLCCYNQILSHGISCDPIVVIIRIGIELLKMHMTLRDNICSNLEDTS